jgi:matrix metalloproteinase-16 (membrane-inserted)
MGVAVHEFGHSLGLGHSHVKGAIMFPWYQAYDTEKSLPEDDRLAIQQIYGVNGKQWAHHEPNHRNTGPPVHKPATTTPPTPTRRTTTSPPTYNPSTKYDRVDKIDWDQKTKSKYWPRYRHNITRPYDPNSNKPAKPITCDTSYDAISLIRNELFIFKDRYYWRMTNAIESSPHNGPHEIHKFWMGLPETYSRIDAVYENKNRKIVFFIGKIERIQKL